MSRAVRDAARLAAAAGLDAADRHLFVLLAAHADHAHEAWPSVALLAELGGRKAATVRRAVRRLEAAGLVALVEAGGGRRSNRYRLALAGTALAPVEASDTVHTPRAGDPPQGVVDNVDPARQGPPTPRAGDPPPRAPGTPERPWKDHRKERFLTGSGWLTG